MKLFIRSILRKVGLYSLAITVENKIITLFKKGDRVNFYSQFVKRGDLVFDVGANEGNRTDIYLSIGAKVVAVEPQEDCYTKLEKRFGNKIDLIKKGLGEKEETKTLYISDTNLISSFNAEHIEEMKKDRFKGVNWDKTADIHLTTLDNLIAKYGTPDFCKIDVEGFEFDVLKGLSSPLKSLSLEYIVPENKDVIVNCINHLNSLGKIECNHSYGESMELGMPNWMEGKAFEEYLKTKEFEATSYGDVYVRFI
ncbi:MAG: FkbM family methyltransferase [Chitinophagales bacterium]